MMSNQIVKLTPAPLEWLRIRVDYPSGARFDTEGWWHGPVVVGDMLAVFIDRRFRETDSASKDRGALILDPRARVKDRATGKVIYDGREWESHPAFPESMKGLCRVGSDEPAHGV